MQPMRAPATAPMINDVGVNIGCYKFLIYIIKRITIFGKGAGLPVNTVMRDFLKMWGLFLVGKCLVNQTRKLVHFVYNLG